MKNQANLHIRGVSPDLTSWPTLSMVVNEDSQQKLDIKSFLIVVYALNARAGL